MTWVRAIGSAPITAASSVLGFRPPAAFVPGALGAAFLVAGAAFLAGAAFFAAATAFFAGAFLAVALFFTPAFSAAGRGGALAAAYFAAGSLAAGVLPAAVLR